MLRTRLCDLLGIEFPVIQAPLGGPWNVSVDLVASVSNAGGLGSIATTLRSAEDVRREIAEVRDLTDKPFAVNHARRPFDEEAFQATLDAKPPVISLALGEPLDLVKRAHDAGAGFMQQVTTVAQARIAAEAGVDVIIAQGGEAGGFGGVVGTLALVPQVVDAVSPIPVVAAGGIADGRGLAAALVLGAEGVNVGTRFLASVEAQISDEWKRMIVAAEAEDAVKIEFAEVVVPPLTEGGWPTVPRALRTPFIDSWHARMDEVATNSAKPREELMESIREGTAHQLIPLTGQSAGQIYEILPASVVVRRFVEEAEEVLRSRASSLAGKGGASPSQR